MKYVALMLMAICVNTMAGNLEDIAATIWDEARGETFEGRQMVASVIWNRGGGTADGMVAAIKKPKQFSGWNGGQRPEVRIANKTDEAVWKECMAFAKAMLGGTFRPVTAATHYHNDKVKPSWRLNLRFVKKVGRHLFYV